MPTPSVVLATAGYDHTVRFWEVRAAARCATPRPRTHTLLPFAGDEWHLLPHASIRRLTSE